MPTRPVDAPSAPPLLLGTGRVSNKTPLTVPPDSARFWLYITRIAPSVPFEEVDDFVKEQLGSNDLQLIRLVAKDVDNSTLRFVSYKVGMSLSLREKALSPDTWPTGFVFRDFCDYGRDTRGSRRSKSTDGSPDRTQPAAHSNTTFTHDLPHHHHHYTITDIPAVHCLFHPFNPSADACLPAHGSLLPERERTPHEAH